MEYALPVRGRGRVQLPAHGIADAEHRVEKELSLLWPDARVQVIDVSRGEGGSRIVEEFSVTYLLFGSLTVEAHTAAAARAAAFRRARELLADSRFVRTEWEAPTRP